MIAVLHPLWRQIPLFRRGRDGSGAALPARVILLRSQSFDPRLANALGSQFPEDTIGSVWWGKGKGSAADGDKSRSYTSAEVGDGTTCYRRGRRHYRYLWRQSFMACWTGRGDEVRSGSPSHHFCLGSCSLIDRRLLPTSRQHVRGKRAGARYASSMPSQAAAKWGRWNTSSTAGKGR